jgi:metal-responsive CopG/Arc/MetJ family transcriptional regulator
MAKIMISIDDELLEKVNSYADRNYTTRSGAITSFVRNGLMQDDITKALSLLAFCTQKIAEDKEISPETKKELEHITMLYEIMSNKAG